MLQPRKHDGCCSIWRRLRVPMERSFVRPEESTNPFSHRETHAVICLTSMRSSRQFLRTIVLTGRAVGLSTFKPSIDRLDDRRRL